MKCEDVDFVALLYGGKLGQGDKQEEMFHHLESCEKCQRQFAELQRTKQLLDVWKDIEPLPYLFSGVLERIEQKEKTISKVTLVLEIGGLVACALVMSLLVFFYGGAVWNAISGFSNSLVAEHLKFDGFAVVTIIMFLTISMLASLFLSPLIVLKKTELKFK